jgi:orotate phosphoribosyltransferase
LAIGPWIQSFLAEDVNSSGLLLHEVIEIVLMDKAQLAKRIFEASYLTGDFVLRSGQRAKEYFDKYQFEALPDLLKTIAIELAQVLDPQTEILAGLELGGVPLATALALETGKPLVFVRKEAKTYGTCKIAEGVKFRGKKLCVIEDVITTGGQVKKSIATLREQGAEIIQVVCVIQRAETQLFQGENFSLRSLFSMNELMKFRS